MTGRSDSNSLGLSNIAASILLVSTVIGSSIVFVYSQSMATSQTASAKLYVSGDAISGSATLVLVKILNAGSAYLSIDKVEIVGEGLLSHTCPNPLKSGMSCEGRGSVSFRQPGDVLSVRVTARVDGRAIMSQREVIVT